MFEENSVFLKHNFDEANEIAVEYIKDGDNEGQDVKENNAENISFSYSNQSVTFDSYTTDALVFFVLSKF